MIIHNFTLSVFRKYMLLVNDFVVVLYRKTDGAAIGSPLGPVLADIFMGNVENRKLKHSIKETALCCMYIDDIFRVCNIRQHSF